MIEATCHCGNIVLSTEQLNETVTFCNCSICYRIGALWAYYGAEQVAVVQKLESKVYTWGDKLRAYHSCSICGCTTHYTQTLGNGTNRVAINTRMADPELYKSIPILNYDGAKSFKYIN